MRVIIRTCVWLGWLLRHWCWQAAHLVFILLHLALSLVLAAFVVIGSLRALLWFLTTYCEPFP